MLGGNKNTGGQPAAIFGLQYVLAPFLRVAHLCFVETKQFGHVVPQWPVRQGIPVFFNLQH